MDADEASHRAAAQKVIDAFEVKPVGERATDLLRALNEAGIEMPSPEAVMKRRLVDLLQSPELQRGVQDVYMSHFGEAELVHLAEVLQDPALRKFLGKRMEILTQVQPLINERVTEILEP